MRYALLLLPLLLACAPATLPAPSLSDSRASPLPPEANPPLPILAAPGPASADLFDDQAPIDDAASPDAEAQSAAATADSSALPTWLRPVRRLPPITYVGSGQDWPKRVGLQVGHWRNEDLPPELERLRASGGGAVGGGYSEVQVNYDLAQRTAVLLRQQGVEVDVIPATVPMDYRADAFVAIHADGDTRGVLRGFKIARSPLSLIPTHDDALVGWLNAEYGRATGLPRDDEHITRRMLFYYAFNNRRYEHAIAPSTPAVIVETGFMTSATDRALLIGTPDRPASGIAAGILGFLGLAH
jgi:N-acetylmuramoyl-L-alanine amidase